MKKMTKALALVLVLSMVCIIFASCGKTLSGTYKLDATVVGSGAVTTYTFSGSKVTLTIETKVLGNVTSTDTFEGKYEISEKDSGDLQITFTFEGDNAEKHNVTSDLVINEDSIKIGILTFKVVE